MNMVNVCPEILDEWKGGVTDVAKIVGLSRKTIIKYAKIGRRGGGLDWKPSKSGRKVFTGREVKRFWKEY